MKIGNVVTAMAPRGANHRPKADATTVIGSIVIWKPEPYVVSVIGNLIVHYC